MQLLDEDGGAIGLPAAPLAENGKRLRHGVERQREIGGEAEGGHQINEIRLWIGISIHQSGKAGAPASAGRLGRDAGKGIGRSGVMRIATNGGVSTGA